MKIENSVFVVTGAGSGLGAGVADMAVDAGAKAMLLDVNEAGLEAVATKLGSQTRFRRADVTSAEDGEAGIAAALDAFGRIDVLVNCAGIVPGERVVGRDGPHDLDLFARVVAVNLTGTFNMLRLAASAMAKQEPGEAGERGVIVNTSSVAAFEGQIGQAAYAASKGGVAAKTLPVARHLARQAHSVKANAPRIFEKPMVAGMPQAVQDALGAAVPFPARLGRPSEYAALVRHIVENPMLNGETIRLDGAIRMQPR